MVLISSCEETSTTSHNLVEQPFSPTKTDLLTPVVTPALISSRTPSPTPTTSSTVQQYLLSIHKEVPLFFQQQFFPLDLTFEHPVTLGSCLKSDRNVVWQGEYVFASVAQFPTILDDIQEDDLKTLWSGEIVDQDSFSQLLISEEFMELFSLVWGEPSVNTVISVHSNQISAALWERSDRIAMVPFEHIVPTMKVLSVNGQNPMVKSFSIQNYRLAFTFCASSETEVKMNIAFDEIPTTNRDPDRLTTLLMTGVTALTRETAYKMEQKGVTYPAALIKDWFDEADLVHISSEAAFTEECPVPEPPFSASRFCSRTNYLELLEYIGTDVIELTGNHLLDYGEDAFLESLSLFVSSGFAYYGGGIDIEEAGTPLVIEDKGNQLAFFGCNVPGPVSVFAEQASGGANPCDIDLLAEMVKQYSVKGYQVIVTIQHYESCQYKPMSGQEEDMRRLAEAGAVIVSGSQAHCPQTMTFFGNRFIHYGLGNLFFDQMWDMYRNAFLDYHVFYDGKYLGVQFITTRLEDASQPRPMTTEERAEFLSVIFSHSEWGTE